MPSLVLSGKSRQSQQCGQPLPLQGKRPEDTSSDRLMSSALGISGVGSFEVVNATGSDDGLPSVRLCQPLQCDHRPRGVRHRHKDMVVVITRYHVGADALPSERGRKGGRQPDGTETRMHP